MLVARDENKFNLSLKLQAPSVCAVVEHLQLHFNSFELEGLARLKLVRYERL